MGRVTLYSSQDILLNLSQAFLGIHISREATPLEDPLLLELLLHMGPHHRSSSLHNNQLHQVSLSIPQGHH